LAVLLGTASYRHAIRRIPIENLLFVFIIWRVGRHFDREMSVE
jgi:hypothetical protein